MKTKCPSCGATASLDVLLSNDGAREAITAALQLPAPLGKLLIQYLGLFRPKERDLSFDRVAKLLGELLPMINDGHIERGGRAWPAPLPAWKEALEQMLVTRDKLQLPMKSHGYLLEIIAGMGSRVEAAAEERREQERQRRTGGSGLITLSNPESASGPDGHTEEKKPSLMDKTPEERREISQRFLKGFRAPERSTISKEDQLKELELAMRQQEEK